MSRRRRPAAPQPPLRRWTIQRATGTGVVAGIAAILVAATLDAWPEWMRLGYALLLALTAFCGGSILWITGFDMRSRGTSGRMRPIRGFDLAVGAALLVPALYALWLVWPELGL
jgi:hypothetical protein